ncbi:peptidoglycan DD-metalloendopeptidase family protein [Christiangramia aquimixticola]|uniref:peptidoglycan DD-metalloendopeptidase family protein n=1 Tax=Christiangramia aquimixticola TaxID=1697558 RepID=UPI003AA7ECB8
MKKLILIIIISLCSCSEIEKAEDLISGLSPRQEYQKDENISDELFQIWKARVDVALENSLKIDLPYVEKGFFKPRNFAIYSYDTYLLPGEVIEIKINTESLSTLIFTTIYKKDNSSGVFEKLKTGAADKKELSFEVYEQGLYKIVIQPEIEANSPFQLEIKKSPSYLFPVINGKNSDIGSYWGDMREGGIRDHKGIDIFANKGTPVLAPTSGKITFSGEKGLGGKQVWLRDSKRKLDLYFAHLDSIIPKLKKVKPGDTLGFVGNTGNAKTTPPHLHFGIYKNRRGAIDPIGFVYQTEPAENAPADLKNLADRIKITKNKAALRNKAALNNSNIVKTGTNGEVLYVQGKTDDWYHVRDSLDRSMYIHESEVTPAL